MQLYTSVTSKGQATIPGFIRQALDIKTGHKLRFRLDKKANRFEAEVIKSDIVTQLAGALKSDSKYISHKQERHMIKDHLAQRHQLIK